MERVTGIGGAFFRANDPPALARWYAEHLGIDNGLEGDAIWWQEKGPTVWAPFPADTEKFGHQQAAMFNFRVRDLDAMLARLRTAGVTVDEHVTVDEGAGRFGYATDPEGNRIELWEPPLSLLGGS